VLSVCVRSAAVTHMDTRVEGPESADLAAEPSAETPTERPGPVRELLLVLTLFAAYKLGRMLAARHVGEAFGNAYHIWHVERWLHIPSELDLQHLLLDSHTAVRIANLYYADVHFPATAAFLVWAYWKRPHHYLWIRRTLAMLTAGALVVHILLPVAPPRMLSGLGLVDTAALVGPAVYGPNSLANQYAAMPSLHIGWAVLIAIGLIATTRTRWRWAWLAHPVLTTLVVISTGNHFWLDGTVACGLLGLAMILPLLRYRASARRTAASP
jgi:PAP2 superfamily protein